jgi:hypothetical protein
MTSFPIIENFNVIEQVGASQIACFVYSLLHTLLLQAAKERFSDCIVPTIPSAAHAGFQVIGATEPFPVVAIILRPLI